MDRFKPAIPTRHINGYTIETYGGFITVKHWLALKDDQLQGTFFKFRDAKIACENADFSTAYQGRLY